MTRSLSERFAGGIAHLIALAGTLHLVVNLIGFPLFPKTTILWLLPNVVFGIVALKWSSFVYDHVLQALAVQVCGIALSLVPWAIRMLRVAGLMGERWYYTGWEGSGATPAWSLMVGIVTLLSLGLFVLATEAAVRGFSGEHFKYPLLGRLTSRMTTKH